jgi:hypothetical protein
MILDSATLQAGIQLPDPPDSPLAIVASAAVKLAQQAGLATPEALAGVAPTANHNVALPSAADGPDALGQLWEQLLGDAERRSQGSHFTPPHIADRVVSIAFARLDDPEHARILDPSVGGGAFLLAAARWLETHTDLSRGDIVARLYGADIDPGAALVADAALQLWANGDARAHIDVVDSVMATGPDWPDAFDVVIGNPPFLSQLASTTSREEDRSAILANRYGHAMGYADESAVFLRRAMELVAAGGVVCLLVPQSVLGASAAAPIRKAVADSCHLRDLWVDGEQVFGASVDVVAPVLVQGAEGAFTRVHVGMDSSAGSAPTPGSETWAPLLAAARQVPTVSVQSNSTLGDLASVTAGFRQHFYGIKDAVAEDDEGASPRLLTAGAIDPLHVRWGERPVKFAGTRYAAPILELDRIADVAVRSWFESRLVPKVLVATQTRVVEAVGDPSGRYVPSVPVIVVEPHDETPAGVWRIAAVLTSPLVSALLAGNNAGTGLSAAAIRISATDVGKLPLPADKDLWDEGARLAEQAQSASSDDSHSKLLIDLASVMTSAYADSSDSFDWWRAQARFPPVR